MKGKKSSAIKGGSWEEGRQLNELSGLESSGRLSSVCKAGAYRGHSGRDTGLLAGRPRIVAGHNNPTSTHGRQNFNYQNRMLTRPQIWAGRADDTVAGDLLCLWHQGQQPVASLVQLTSWVAAGDQLASEELGAHSEGQAGQSRQGKVIREGESVVKGS